MCEIIEELEKKGFRIAITPDKSYGNWQWHAGVYVGDSTKATWIVNKEKGSSNFNSYREAFETVLEYCNSYKPRGRKN